jgi:hypothetical protein
VGEPEGKRPLGRFKRRWEDNVKLDLREIGCSVTDWIHLAVDTEKWLAYVNTVLKSRVPKNVGKLLSS